MPNTKSAPTHLALCCTAEDFQIAAKEVLPNKSWVYVSSQREFGSVAQIELERLVSHQFPASNHEKCQFLEHKMFYPGTDWTISILCVSHGNSG